MVAGDGKRVLNAGAAHDRDEEDNCDTLESHVDEGEEESDRADVLESLPGVGVLEGLSGPDFAHHEDPQEVHHDGHHRQKKHLDKTEQEQTR